MKKNSKLHAFTLVELIIVMAIMAILMAALLNFMKPVRTAFVDSTLYENQRTVQNGIGEYLTESVRYASDLGIYSSTKVANVEAAENAFMKKVTGYTYAEAILAGGSDLADFTEKEYRLQVITIDNVNNYSFGGKDYKGRIIRRKLSSASQHFSLNDDDPTTTVARLALGATFYGKSDYSIAIEPDTTKGSIKFTTTSIPESYLKSGQSVSTEYMVSCPNLVRPSRIFDTDLYDTSIGSTTDNTKTYIIFLLPE